MSFRAIVVVLISVFLIVVLQATLAQPLTTVSTTLNETGDYSDLGGHDGNEIITNLPGHWFNMGLIAIFGAMAWASFRVLRRELTRGGGGGGL